MQDQCTLPGLTLPCPSELGSTMLDPQWQSCPQISPKLRRGRIDEVSGPPKWHGLFRKLQRRHQGHQIIPGAQSELEDKHCAAVKARMLCKTVVDLPLTGGMHPKASVSECEEVSSGSRW